MNMTKEQARAFERRPMDEKDRRLIKFALNYLKGKLDDHFSLHPAVQRAIGAPDSQEVEARLNKLINNVTEL